ncbi:phosphotransferase family protein [Halomarina ordinaria]|uniref:Phosphotransferase family protein n=1 Tax=Halomarina ordinaria TaxID=3033939 RepID=A0ABD5UD03_9EURY|nr:phosphotransferase family protein [Halomarina sp. PSRA2]
MTDSTPSLRTPELDSYLSDRLETAVTGIEVLNDGLNLVAAVSTDEGRYVLRRPNKLRHTELFNDLLREYRLLERLRPTAIPAPSPVLFCDDESLLGDAFFLTTYLDGETVPLGTDLPERFRTPGARRRVAHHLVDVLAAIHSLDPEPFETVCGRTTPREQVTHATARLDAAASVTGRNLPRLRRVGQWLRRNAPAGPETALVHGDYRPGNVLFAGNDRPELTGVLDWETAMFGDPRTELGYLLLRWRDDGDPALPLDDLNATYPDDALREVQVANERGLAPFTAAPGSPDRGELIARYEDQTGLTYEADDRFYRAHAAFMLATVWEDLHRHRLETGAESDWPPHVDYMAMVAESIVEHDS